MIAALTCLVALLCISSAAAGDSEANAQLDRCICGREYFHDTTQSHAKYDCTKCGKPLSECSCSCWCGADTQPSSFVIGQTHLRECKGCGKLCGECTCADYNAMLGLEKMQNDGTVAIHKIPISQSTPVMTLSFILILITMLCFVLLLSGDKLHKTKKRQRQEMIQQSTHSKILDKIETQAEKKAVIAAREGEFDISRFPFDWKLKTGNGALAAYELANTLNLQQDALPATAEDFIRYAADSICNKEKAQFDAAAGQYGSVLQAVDNSDDQVIKSSIANSISGYEADAWELNKLQQLSKKANVKAAGAAKLLSEIKMLLDEEYLEERTRVIKHNPRFPGGGD